ncbi:GspH/FimT family pseudopilin [Xanthomonas prunicola]|uniref:Type II secretion system protein H n=1 Tax=Xanthomonas prunicola TaxID=2053930 RepID=A0A9Q9IXQ8_9XANT|nr:GspH/FimT family pseudopilin [Xanthomonas prunicola]USI99973.1 GspH/FimT family pseudopilin [Xanthomonas prunicola]UXA48441.1 GspH/FimT family pseudopilin [Xanthomonas prunicola]UXA53720.1 GspH/FimT family pseudopilin [Xanthomonas prunicola]UXA56905.1 GspH/FimT family pseudopilin [Xanthomonas prunicola]UXA62864.1 GspH/FimT family pseudopilin [Xanthomonas prunicola]
MGAASYSSARGYTAVQLLIVMAIIGIGAAIGMPSFKSLIEWQRATTRVHVLTAHLAMARSFAITQGEPVSICPSMDGARCRTDRDWSRGWILFKDPERGGQPLSAVSVLRVEHASSSGGIDITSTAGRAIVRFLPNGRSTGTNITISLCRNARRLADVVVNNSGRARTVRYTSSVSCMAR